MFSGIVEEAAKVFSCTQNRAGGIELEIDSSLDHSETKLGDSICVDGVCLTVVKVNCNSNIWRLKFDLASETVRRTMLGKLVLGKLESGVNVHIERSLAIGDRLHGHFVTGHIDTTATMTNRETEGQTIKMEFQVDSRDDFDNLMLAEKGSIALSGVSLTLGAVKEDIFNVYIIPHTDEITKLGKLAVGDKVNVEFDILARYVKGHLHKGIINR